MSTCSTSDDDDASPPKMRDLTNTEIYTLSVLSVGCLAILYNAWKSDGEPLFASLAISGLAFAFSYATILWTGDVFIKRGYKGKDLSKKTPIEMYAWFSLISRWHSS